MFHFFQFTSTSIYLICSFSYQFILIFNLFFFFTQFCSISIRLLFLQSSVLFMPFWHICSKKALLTPSCFVTFLFLKFPLIFWLLGTFSSFSHHQTFTPKVFIPWNGVLSVEKYSCSSFSTEKWYLLVHVSEIVIETCSLPLIFLWNVF